MLWFSDYQDEIEKAQQYIDQPVRFTLCANGWMFEGNHHRHYIQTTDDGLRCSCETFKRKAPAGQPWCEHTRAAENLMATGALKAPKPIVFPLASAPNDLTLFAPT